MLYDSHKTTRARTHVPSLSRLCRVSVSTLLPFASSTSPARGARPERADSPWGRRRSVKVWVCLCACGCVSARVCVCRVCLALYIVSSLKSERSRPPPVPFCNLQTSSLDKERKTPPRRVGQRTNHPPERITRDSIPGLLYGDCAVWDVDAFAKRPFVHAE